MKRTAPSRLLLWLLLLVMSLVSGCGGEQGASQSITGRWQSLDEDCYVVKMPHEIEFFSDGKFYTKNRNRRPQIMFEYPNKHMRSLWEKADYAFPEDGDYAVVDSGRVRLQGRGSGTTIVNYELKGDAIRFTGDTLCTTWYRRAETAQATPVYHQQISDALDGKYPPIYIEFDEKSYREAGRTVEITVSFYNTRSKPIKSFTATEALVILPHDDVLQLSLPAQFAPPPWTGSVNTPLLPGDLNSRSIYVSHSRDGGRGPFDALVQAEEHDIKRVIRALSQQVTYSDGTTEAYP